MKELVAPKEAPVRGVDSESDAVVAGEVFNALAAGPSNSVLSSNRAYLQSAGIWGWDWTAQGWEAVRLHLVRSPPPRGFQQLVLLN